MLDMLMPIIFMAVVLAVVGMLVIKMMDLAPRGESPADTPAAKEPVTAAEPSDEQVTAS